MWSQQTPHRSCILSNRMPVFGLSRHVRHLPFLVTEELVWQATISQLTAAFTIVYTLPGPHFLTTAPTPFHVTLAAHNDPQHLFINPGDGWAHPSCPPTTKQPIGTPSLVHKWQSVSFGCIELISFSFPLSGTACMPSKGRGGCRMRFTVEELWALYTRTHTRTRTHTVNVHRLTGLY